MLVTTYAAFFFPFPTMFSSFPKTNFNSLVTVSLSSANAFTLDRSKILSFGTELKFFNSHISVYVCSFFEFEAVSKWCIRERVNQDFQSLKVHVTQLLIGKTKWFQLCLFKNILYRVKD